MPRRQSPPRSRRRPVEPSLWQGTVRLGGVFAVLIAVNVYFFFFRGGTSVRDLLKATEIRPEQTAAAARPPSAKGRPGPGSSPAAGRGAALATAASVAPPSLAATDLPDDATVVVGETRDGETLATVLRREHVPARTAADVTAAAARIAEARTLRPGVGYTLRFDAEDRLRTVDLALGPSLVCRVERRAQGTSESWRAVRESGAVSATAVGLGGTVRTTLHEAVVAAGGSASLASRVGAALAGDLHPYVDPQPGDRFRLLVERQLVGSRLLGYGRLLAVEYVGRAGVHRALHFARAADDGATDRASLYDERGEPVAKSLLREPLACVGLPVGFDRKRLRPVAHTERAYLGVDYGAPAGTPVWAIADGHVRFRGARGAGSAADGVEVVVAHPGGMESIYMHLGRLARGLEPGEPVRQGQVLGYVAAAAAPHVHLSVKLGGHFVDPTRLKPARAGTALAGDELDAFRRTVAPRLEALARIDVPPAAASALASARR